MKYRNIDIVESGIGYIYTRGLINFIKYEIRIKSFDNSHGELALLYFMIDYILNESPKIQNNETISYGLWLLKFVRNNEYYEIYELDDEFKSWQEGADNAIYYIEQQKLVCKEEGAEFKVPLFVQNIAITAGVLEGLRVQGIRYNEPEHMCGWYLTTSDYDGNIRNMKVVSLQALVVGRKDLLQFLALPPGFIFEITENDTYRVSKAPFDIINN